MSEISRTGEPQMPRRTAGYFPDDNNPQYWVQTLNEPQRDRAQAEAAYTARSECRQYRKGGRKHGDLVAQVRSLSAEAKAAYLGEHQILNGRAQREAADKHPIPDPPEQQPEQSSEQWMAACDAWEAEKKKIEGKRRKAEDAVVESRRKEALAMDARERERACIDAGIERHFWGAFVEALRVETLLRAVRDPDDHRLMRFEMAQEIDDLQDAGAGLWDFYNALDPVSPSEVPT